MHTPWDDTLKRTFSSHPQDFVKWLLPGAKYQGSVSIELKTLTRSLFTDILYKVVLDGQEVLVHIEFQRYPEKDMDRRVWQYNVLATLEHNLPVFSFVIYLAPKGEIPEPCIEWKHPRGTIHFFQYWHIKLWEMSYRELLTQDLVGLLPLCILAKDGTQKKVASQIFSELQAKEEKALLVLALSFASLIFKESSEAQWLEGEIEKMEDMLSDTLFYQKILKKGEQKGIEEGKQEGIEEGKQKGTLQTLTMLTLDTVQGRFPALLDLAQKQLLFVRDTTLLRTLHNQIVLASSEKEAERYLRKITKGNA